MRLLALVSILATALAGCVDGDPTRAPTLPDGTTAEDGQVENITALPLWGPARDPWAGDVTELELWSGTVQAGTVNTEGGCLMCARFVLPAGTLVPEGTGKLRVEGDASGAHRTGGWFFQIETTRARDWQDEGADGFLGEYTTDASHTWWFDVEPKDWDVPDTAASWWLFSLWGGSPGPLHVIEGPVKIRIVAERDPTWIPLPPLDLWDPANGHPVPANGVVELVDVNVTATYDSATECPSGSCSTTAIPWERSVPQGAEQVAVALIMSETERCQGTDQCSARGGLRSGSRSTTIKGALVNEVGPGYRILVYDVGDHITVDGPYVNGSLSWHSVWLDDCSPGVRKESQEACFLQDVAGAEATVRYVAEAWRGPVDVAAMRQRLGV